MSFRLDAKYNDDSGTTGASYSVEPVPHKARWLREKFPEVEVKEVALADTSGEVTFYHNVKKSGFSGLRQHQAASDHILEFTVRCELLDNILPSARRVDFIKVDVEGGELAVLSGAAKTLSRYHPTLLFECTRSGLASFGFTSRQIFDFLTQQHSYSVFLLKNFLDHGNPLNFEEFDSALHYPFKAFNFVAAS